jgi:hypothetical protein
MANSPKRRLKVFQAQFGFYDTVVAVPSQAEALRIWGTRQNLFAEGEATPAKDSAAIAAALAHPGVPLRRAIGSKAAYAVQPTDAADIPLPAKAKTRAPAKAAPAPKAKTADRSKLAAAEAKLTAVEAARKAEETKLQTRRDALEADEAEAQASYVAARKAATAAVAAARAAYRDAGGEDEG